MDKIFCIVIASVVGCLLSLDLVLQIAARMELSCGELKLSNNDVEMLKIYLISWEMLPTI